MLELRECDVQACQPERAPRAGEVRPDLDVHAPTLGMHPLVMTEPQSLAGRPPRCQDPDMPTTGWFNRMEPVEPQNLASP